MGKVSRSSSEVVKAGNSRPSWARSSLGFSKLRWLSYPQQVSTSRYTPVSSCACIGYMESVEILNGQGVAIK
jgi:hypothetical protein